MRAAPGWLVSLLVLAVVQPATGEVRDGRIGASCDSESPCEDGLACMPPDWGVPRGLCVAACRQLDDCLRFSATAVCLAGTCIEGCEPNSSLAQALQPTQCHGRPDMGCGLTCGELPTCVAACFPVCTTDDQCGDGFCNRGTGQCQYTPTGSDPPGAACDPSDPVPSCRGSCSVSLDRLVLDQTLQGVCKESCVIGAEQACGPSPRPGVELACLGTPEAHGFGDLGGCFALCNCSSDCLDNERCERVELGDRFDAAGVCRDGERSARMADCLSTSADGGAGADCPDGAVRACSTDTCLGTAECLPGGGYAACECLEPSNTGGRAPAGTGAAPTSRETSVGCRVTRTQQGSALAAMLSCLVLGGLARRSHRTRNQRSQS